MKPTASQYKKLFYDALLEMPEGADKERWRLLMSCALTAAQTVERVEYAVLKVVTPALAELRSGTAPAAPAEAAQEESEEGAKPPLRADVKVTGPATHSTAPTGASKVTAAAPGAQP